MDDVEHLQRPDLRHRWHVRQRADELAQRTTSASRQASTAAVSVSGLVGAKLPVSRSATAAATSSMF
jgi:hypothetical protein